MGVDKLSGACAPQQRKWLNESRSNGRIVPMKVKPTKRMELRLNGGRTTVVFERDFRIPEPEPAAADLLVVFDTNTRRLFGRGVAGAAVVPCGEAAKSWRHVLALHRAALDRNLTRTGAMVGVGGGAVCDLTALAASLYMRGCRLALAPTTLLAMVDAAIGGKTGINYLGYKNMIGTFFPAETVRIGISALDSLPENEYRNGLGEVIKAALLGDPALYETLSRRREAVLSRDADLLLEIIRSCVAVKGRFVEEDFRESGRRAHLNLGHTFAHALESTAGLRSRRAGLGSRTSALRLRAPSHGEAVAWGIARAMDLGVRLGITDAAYAEEVRQLLDLYGFRLSVRRSSAERLVDAMVKDKKRQGEKPRFVLQRRLTETVVEEVDAAAVRALLEEAGGS